MKNKAFMIFLCLLLAGASITAVITGCKGSDSREEVDDVVEEMTGKKNVDRMQRMKEDIDAIKEQQQRRYDQTDEDESE